MCEICSFVAEPERNLRNHKGIEHIVEDDNWSGVWYDCALVKVILS